MTRPAHYSCEPCGRHGIRGIEMHAGAILDRQRLKAVNRQPPPQFGRNSLQYSPYISLRSTWFAHVDAVNAPSEHQFNQRRLAFKQCGPRNRDYSE